MRAVMRGRITLLALAVGLVLADSSVVTLGLPDVLEELRATPQGVSWVLTAYNLALALAAIPAALLLRRADAGRVATAGLAVFAVASLTCALAPSLGVLVGARVVQGVGGAAAAVAALSLLSGALGDPRRGAALWAAAGAIGAAVGPAAGGVLTDAFSWESIFLVQVPLALACLAAVPRTTAARLDDAAPGEPPHWRVLAALACLGAGLTAALFLLVLLLIAGWRVTPILAAVTVSVMPVAALLASRVRPGLDARTKGAAGAVLTAGGLAALGLLPGASVAWTIAPQVLVGLGLGLALPALTEAAMHGRSGQALHGAWTIAARHAGIVVALALLTPVFTADLEEQALRTQEAVLAKLIDAPLGTTAKLQLGLELADTLDASQGRVPDVDGAFAAVRKSAGPADGPALDEARAHVDEQLDRAATSAFERSFLIAAALTAGALLPLLVGRRRRRA
jgi:MFS family permease